MRLTVKTLKLGTHEVEAEPTDHVGNLKGTIEGITRTPIEHQRLIFAGKQLEDTQLLKDCGLEDGATLQLVVREGQTGGNSATATSQNPITQTPKKSACCVIF
mmetsp:Transcript_70303/g.81943  ORF Transcript_70303/g.81943 Transcript_70303/m.81943 type:complete len:103 (-) Transcript_70303:176-484(-)